MLNLAIHAKDGTVPISRIAAQEEISPNYIEQLFLKLKEHGLVESIRGRSGGYKLSKPPKKITVAEIITAVEGPIKAVSCAFNGNCKRYEICTTKFLWEQLSRKINSLLEDITLQDLCEMGREKMSGDLGHKLIFNI